ncbi:transcription factor grauzone-like [Ochlerotatus camptorhynchus]|uniref:transcription factor grauzone-like n=1 Tax=Ochlerotatus camptorhynchus TaxID=644619 RepID=UPI0031D2BF3B
MSAVEPCLTCFRKTDNYLRITDETNADDVERIVTTHFWFSETECASSVLCTSCWEKIDDFHKFYCEVRNVHLDNRADDEPVGVQIKVEPLEAPIKREINLDTKEEDDEGEVEEVDKLAAKAEPVKEVKDETDLEQKESEEVPVKKKRGRKRKLPEVEVEAEQKVKPAPTVEVTVDPEEQAQSDDDSDWEPPQDDDSGEEFAVKQKRSKGEKKPRKKYAPRKPRKEDEDRASNGKTKEDIAKEDEFIRRYCPIYCDKCNFSSDTFGELKAHTTTAHNCNPMVICCDHKFYKRSFLYQHAQYHENPDKFKCQTCSKIFHSGLALKLHLDYTHVKDEERIYKCNVCEASFAKAYHLTSHRLKHTSIAEKRFYCVECDIAFRTNQSYRTHLHSKHGAAAKYVCDICARGFRQRSDLLTHQLSHSAEGLEKLKIQCERCGKWMKNKKSIWTHRKICQSTGPVACDICGKMAPNPEQLKSHKKFMHQDQRVHQCSYCEKAFKRPIDLKEHETIHTGEVLYSCQFCAKTFNSNSNLYSHRRKMHPVEYADWKQALQMKKQPVEAQPTRVIAAEMHACTSAAGAATAIAMPAELPPFLPPGLMPAGVLPLLPTPDDGGGYS